MSLLKKKYFSYFVPFLVMMLFAFIEAVFFVQGQKETFLISFLVCFTFYFSVFNPKNLNILFVFFVGVFSDLLLFFPLGFQSFVLCLTAFLACFYKRSLGSFSFKGQWGVFTLVFTIVFILALSLLNLCLDKTLSPVSFMINYVAIVLAYPFIASLSAYINQKTGAGV